MRTLAKIEAAHAIEWGVKQRGKFDEATVSKLVALYREEGIVFLPTSGLGAGIRYRPVE